MKEVPCVLLLIAQKAVMPNIGWVMTGGHMAAAAPGRLSKTPPRLSVAKQTAPHAPEFEALKSFWCSGAQFQHPLKKMSVRIEKTSIGKDQKVWLQRMRCTIKHGLDVTAARSKVMNLVRRILFFLCLGLTSFGLAAATGIFAWELGAEPSIATWPKSTASVHGSNAIRFGLRSATTGL
ncbi:MAG: hypothetical protein ACYC5H_01930 [Methylovirgula sp.]